MPGLYTCTSALFLLNCFDVINECVDSCLDDLFFRTLAGDERACLELELITPDRHVAWPVDLNFLAAIDHVGRTFTREHASVFLAELR